MCILNVLRIVVYLIRRSPRGLDCKTVDYYFCNTNTNKQIVRDFVTVDLNRLFD